LPGDGRRRRSELRMIASPDGREGTLLPARLLCSSEGWSMLRRIGGAKPFVVPEAEWVNAPVRREGGAHVTAE
jgi:hypothetical protein